MGRTNIVLDDGLVERVMRIYGLKTKREAVHFALQKVAGDSEAGWKKLKDLRGIGWEGDLEEMRRGWRPPGDRR